MPKTTEPKPIQEVAADVAAKTEVGLAEVVVDDVGVASINVYAETPATANVFVISHDGFHWQINVRSQAAIEEVHHLLELMAYVETMSLAGGFRPKAIGGQIVSHDTLPAATPGVPLTPPELPGITTPPELEYIPDQQATPPSTTPAVNTFRCVFFEITPRSDGKVGLKFYGNTHKTPVDEYPTVTFTGTPEKAVELVAPVWPATKSQFERAVKYTVSWDVDWALSQRKNERGSPYKDVVAIRKAQ